MRNLILCMLGVVVLLPHSASAEEKAPRSKALIDLVACRSLAENAERLACYDRKVAEIDSAERDQELVILDRQQLEERDRENFGRNSDAGRRRVKNPEPEIQQIDTVVAGIGTDPAGNFLFTTEAGSKWVQIDDRPTFAVKSGMKVTIKKAMFGSYYANFQGAIAIRVKRTD